jgi:glutathione-regulated potassium-efflux system ancillary protein KefC
MHTAVGENAFSVLLFQDIAVIPILVLMPLLAAHGVAAPVADKVNMVSHLPGYAQALAVAGVITLVVVAGRYLSHSLFHIIAKTNLREVFTATSLALVIGITILMQMVGVSPALGAFVAGVVLANSHYRRTLEMDIEPFKGLLLGLFFISVGMSMNFDLMAEKPFALLATVFGLMLIKTLIIFGLGKFFGLSSLHNAGFALAISQGGEFAFVLFQFTSTLHVVPSELAKFLTLAVALSMAVTPLLMLIYSRFVVPRFMSVLPLREYDTIEASNAIILAGFGRFGQVIGRFMFGQGMKMTVLEKDPDQIALLRKFGFKAFFGDASRLDLLKSAGADKAKLLIVAVDDADTCMQIVRLAREEFPHVKIFARARNRKHAYELHSEGVEYFKRETFDSSLTMAQEIMVFLGKDPTEMRRKAERFLEHDEATLRKSFDFFDDEPELVNFARLRTAELEQILRDDIKETDKN